jgi:hypothetical protein
MEMPEMNPEEYVQKYTDDDIETQPHLPSSDREDDTKADHQSGNAGAKECQYDETAATEGQSGPGPEPILVASAPIPAPMLTAESSAPTVKTPDAVVQAAHQPEQAAASEPPEAKPEQPTIADHLSPADPATVAAETPTDLEKPSAPPVAQSTASAPTSNQEASTGQEARQEEPDAPVSITGKNTAPPPPALTSGEEELTPADDNAHPEQSQSSYHVYDDYDLLKDYKDAYEQILDVTTGQTRFAILEQPPPPIITGVGIGGRSMAPQEKELEYKRWQTALLTKIPEQPTASELGMASRVFGLEDRRKRIQEELEEEQRNKKLKRSPVKVENEDDDRDTYEEKDDDEDDKEYKDGDDDVEVGKKNGNGHRDDDEMKEEKDDDRPKRVKAMSLIPVPSFYDQDLYRVRLVHADLLATSIHEHARRRISEATNDYNRAFRVSNELYNQRVKLQNDVAMIDHQQRLFLTKFKNDYAVQVTLARARWQKSKEEWEHNQAHKTMQGMFGQMPVGTNKTQAAARHPNQVVNTVGLTLGRVVDAVVLKLEGGSGREQFEEFVPPHAPDFDAIVVDKETGETYGQRNQRIQASAHQQLQTLNMQLQQSEEERKRAWRKLCKTKAEYELPTSGRRRVDPDLAAQTPVPPLRASSAVPSAASFQPTSMATYVPQSKPKYQLSNPSESKYSAARVRERISSDGTVAPVTAPKRDKDGLYMRPAGRTRKGMNWDAIRGIWVPAPMR